MPGGKESLNKALRGLLEKITKLQSEKAGTDLVSTSAAGLAPTRPGGTTKFLRADGTWAVPPDDDTVYTHPTTAGNKHIPSGGSSGQFLGWSASGTAKWTNIDVPEIVDSLTSTSTTSALSANQGSVLDSKIADIDSNLDMGQGYASCSTASSTTAKTASLSGYALTKGGIVAVRFGYAVPASSTLNINSTGAKTMRYRNATIVDGVIGAGDIATFMYDGTYYQLISVSSGRPVNDLTTSDTYRPLSANQGRVLKGLVDGKTEIALLWENSSPDSGFGEQDITVSLSGYDLMLVVFAGNAGSVTYDYVSNISHVISGTRSIVSLAAGYSSADAGVFLGFRKYALSSLSKVHFYPGKYHYYSTLNGGTPTTSNNHLVPHAIYGIKGVL